MRNALCEALIEQAADPNFVFLTGDLGFGALEPLQAALGDTVSQCRHCRAEHGLGRRRTGAARDCGPGSTASRRSCMRVRLSRSATISACTVCPCAWSATAAATLTASWAAPIMPWKTMGRCSVTAGDAGLCPRVRHGCPRHYREAGRRPVPGVCASGTLRIAGRSRLRQPMPPGAACWKATVRPWRPSGRWPWASVAELSSLTGQARPSLWVVTELPIRRSTMPEAFSPTCAAPSIWSSPRSMSPPAEWGRCWRIGCCRRASPRASSPIAAPGAIPSGCTARSSSIAVNAGWMPSAIRVLLEEIAADTARRISCGSLPELYHDLLHNSQRCHHQTRRLWPVKSPGCKARSSCLARVDLSARTCCVLSWPSASDVVGTVSRFPAWRLEGTPEQHVRAADLLVDANLDALLGEPSRARSSTASLMGPTRLRLTPDASIRPTLYLTTRLLARLADRRIACYVHAGSSSEYGDLAAGRARRKPPLRTVITPFLKPPAPICCTSMGPNERCPVPTCACIRSTARWKTRRG